jgi:hypothetical protein
MRIDISRDSFLSLLFVRSKRQATLILLRLCKEKPSSSLEAITLTEEAKLSRWVKCVVLVTQLGGLRASDRISEGIQSMTSFSVWLSERSSNYFFPERY